MEKQQLVSGDFVFVVRGFLSPEECARFITRSEEQGYDDAPITTALEKQYGGGTVAIIQSNPVLEKIGIEELTLSSAYDAKYPKDEDHSWIAIELDRIQDAWVRNITARHFADSAVFVGHRARRVTVIDSRSEAPVSEPGGYRRQSFVVGRWF